MTPRRISCTVDATTLRAADAEAARLGTPRARLLREALIHHLGRGESAEIQDTQQALRDDIEALRATLARLARIVHAHLAQQARPGGLRPSDPSATDARMG